MSRYKKIDLNLIIPFLLFFMISILCIKSASIYTSSSLGNLVLKQSVWYLIGCILIIIILKLKNNFLFRFSYLLYILGNILLLSLLIFAKPINNSKCWFTIPGIGSFQPSEFMKISLMLVLSVMIEKYYIKNKNNSTLKSEFLFLIKTLIIVLIPSILTFLEPDTGAVIMYLVIYFCMMITSYIRLRWFVIVGFFTIIFAGSFTYLYFFKSNLFINIFGTKLFYRLDRIFEWKNGTGMQLENALSSIGSSGIFGYGLSKTPIYFPESSTDFIFAVFASNFGFLLTIFLILVILYFDIYIIMLMKKNIDLKNRYLTAGISSCLVFQHVQNIGMTLGIFPITGITLPFISYGGSSLLSYMIMLGIILNISNMKKNKYNL